MFEDFLGGLPADRREAFAAVIAQVGALVPEAEEGRSYGMPAFGTRASRCWGSARRRRT